MSKKSKREKLPKRLGGIKLPKAVRKAGGELLAWSATVEGRSAIAALLTAGAAAIGAPRASQGAIKPAGQDAHTRAAVPQALQQLFTTFALGAAALMKAADSGKPAPSAGGEGNPQRPH